MDPQMHWQRLSEHLYCFEDTCNVYAVVADGEAVLIDFGSGAVLDHLGEIGVRPGAGDPAHAPPPRPVPGRPARRGRRHPHLGARARAASLRARRAVLGQQAVVRHVQRAQHLLLADPRRAGGRVLEDFGTWTWGPYTFTVLPTPGHTLGSLTLLVTVDGQRVAFTGDLLYAAGKVVTMYDMQYNYGAVDGVEAAILSLGNLTRRAAHSCSALPRRADGRSRTQPCAQRATT